MRDESSWKGSVKRKWKVGPQKARSQQGCSSLASWSVRSLLCRQEGSCWWRGSPFRSVGLPRMLETPKED